MPSQSITQLFDLSAKTALVTGGAKGIGQAIVFRLAEAGAKVVFTDIDEDAARQTVMHITANGGQAHFIRADVNDLDAIPAVIDETLTRFTSLHILVNNAGIFPSTPALEITRHIWERVSDSNLKSTFFYSQAVLQHMCNTGQGGKIINVATTDAIHPTEHLAHYSAAKAGIVMLTKTLALEFGPYHINVNTIAPGFIDTPGTRAARQTPQIQEQLARVSRAELAEQFLARRPLRRLGEPDDVAKVALFLASDAASYMTGALVLVDGGYLLS